MKIGLLRSIVMLTVLTVSMGACRRTADPEQTSVVDASVSAVANSGIGKWSMPEPMMVHIKALEADLEAFETSPEKNHGLLAAKIDEHVKKVMATCTMEGKAHDTLHDWLMPLIQLNKDYAAAPEEEKSAKLQAIRQSMADFHQRFE